MERVAAAPVDQARVGIGPPVTVEIVAAAGRQQHVGDPGDGDPASAGVLADRQGRRGDRLARIPDVRTEEHTSELQSLMRISYAVFCLKKQNSRYPVPTPHTLYQ